MTVRLYVIYDTVAEMFASSIFEAPTTAVAVREFHKAVDSRPFPEDFRLFYCGDWFKQATPDSLQTPPFDWTWAEVELPRVTDIESAAAAELHDALVKMKTDNQENNQ